MATAARQVALPVAIAAPHRRRRQALVDPAQAVDTAHRPLARLDLVDRLLFRQEVATALRPLALRPLATVLRPLVLRPLATALRPLDQRPLATAPRPLDLRPPDTVLRLLLL